MKYAKILLTIGLFLIAGLSAALFFLPATKHREFEGADIMVRVTQTIDYGGKAENVTQAVDVLYGTSAFDLLKQTHNAQVKEYDFGPLVQGIDGVLGGEDGKYWTFAVDGVEASESAQKVFLLGNEQVLWKYSRYEE